MMKTILFVVACFFIFGFAHAQYGLPSYTVASTPWADSLGNVRAEINVNNDVKAAGVFIPWRRRDEQPENKRLIITDSQGHEVKNIYRIDVNQEYGEFIFEPIAGKGTYYIYYMPYKGTKNIGWFEGSYLLPEEKADENWIVKNDIRPDKKIEKATIKGIQARTAFDSFYPMEVIATQHETNLLVQSHSENYLLFAESRKYPIRMTEHLPFQWIGRSNDAHFLRDTCFKNEYYAFQVGMYASKKNIKNVSISYRSPFVVTCFNTEGIDYNGNKFAKQVSVSKDKIQPLWFGVDVPKSARPGNYTVDVIIRADNEPSQTITLQLYVGNQILEDRGDREPWRHSRLRWLNSTLGFSDKPTQPYTELQLKNKAVQLYLRKIELNETGMPKSIVSGKDEILQQPIQFVVETAKGNEILQPQSFKWTKITSGKIDWQAVSSNKNISLKCNGSIEYDGTVDYTISITAENDITVKDIRLELPLRSNIAKYFMGMGLPGSACPQNYNWKWSGPQDSYWIGNENAGLHCEMKGASYVGPMLNLYHPAPPASWCNDNAGGFSLTNKNGASIATTYSGKRNLSRGQSISFQFDLLITPVKKINTAQQFTNRYFHNAAHPAPTGDDMQAGVKIINVHHANGINPFINYPFIAVDSMRKFVNDWHSKGMKVKVYYTVRELTTVATELWALRSLGDEILAKGNGGGYIWLREHLEKDYAPQWFTPIEGYQQCDAAILTSGASRWFNYYLEGLKWLIKNVDIDGIYLDDVAFDRNMLKRIRNVMESVKPGCVIDLHSNTGFSIGPANQYTSYFPFIDKLWFGESFQYDKMSPENWMVETSGIPFGLMGDMLQGGGNPWRGMVYGMTARLPWTTDDVVCNPKEIWKVWDEFNIAQSTMTGYWNNDCPVKTDNRDVLATVYLQKGKALISIASWAKEKVDVHLIIDWKKLGIDSAKAQLVIPGVKNFQSGKKLQIGEAITVEPTKGYLVEIQ